VSGSGYLLLRRGGGLFGVASADVLGLSRPNGCFRVETRTGGLTADEVVGVAAELDVSPVAPLVRRFWPEAADGWAIHAGAPVVVVDPRRPPTALAGGGSRDGE